MEIPFQISTGQLEEVEDDVNTAVAVAVATNRNVLMEIDENEEEETPISHSAIIDTQNSVNQAFVSDSRVPDDVQLFLINLCDSIATCDVEKIRYYRENVYSSLTFKYYMKTRWPNVSTFENLFENSGSNKELAKLLYLELYYRHVFAKFPNHVKWQDRVSSWKNYIALFCYLLSRPNFQKGSSSTELPKTLAEYFESNLNTKFEDSKDVSLPSETIHGIVDEFIYQFQDTCRYRTRIFHVITNNDQPQNDNRNIKVDQDVWRCDIILLILQSFVDLSEIRSLLSENVNSQSDQLQSVSSTGTFPIQLQLGYFSLYGLLRLHTLLGNYYTAIEISNDIDNQLFRGLLWKTPAYVSYLYYLGYSYLMLQRYIDAIRIFQQSTVNFSSNNVSPGNNTNHSSSPYQHDSVGKFVDRMSWLMLFCQLLSYGSNSGFIRMEESLSHQNDRKSQASFMPFGPDISNWKELFSKVSPRFVSPSIPVNSKEQLIKVDQNESQQRQIQTFSPLVHLYELTSMIKSFTKLYNNLNVDTLANLMHIAKKNGNLRLRDSRNYQGNEVNIEHISASIILNSNNIETQDPSEIARSKIIAIKSRSGRQRIWKTGENLLYGDLISLNGDIDLLLDLDTIRITEGKQTDKFFGDVFAKQILKSRNLLRHIDSLTSKVSDVSSRKEKV
ncbi:hypothetical protein FG386_001759 [Cryptosporidium ryanae]|uniref:uncharacterized protein n=1 Tax=Cryptosporidium ryanae TaxID=515981 RepID=UPI00351A4EDF|nr:hypothetical protein FG386_001759 [Cryptosporidium ryanae]